MYFYFKDLPYGEIATALNISVGTVKARLHREKFFWERCVRSKVMI